jgi:FtsH-binding integral membrane protein
VTHDLNYRRYAEPDMATRRAVDAGLRQHMLRVYNYMAGGLAVTGATAAFAVYSGLYATIAGTPLMWLIVLAPLAIAFFLGFRIERMSLGAAQAAFWTYAVVIGLSLAGIFLVYTETSIARVFFITAATFLGMSLWGYTTRSDLTGFGSFLMMGLMGVVIAGLVNLLLGSQGLQFVISVIAIIVFTGLTAWDTQRIKEMYFAGQESGIAGKAAILGALALYLDFINLFLSLLQLFGDRRDR